MVVFLVFILTFRKLRRTWSRLVENVSSTFALNMDLLQRLVQRRRQTGRLGLPPVRHRGVVLQGIVLIGS